MEFKHFLGNEKIKAQLSALVDGGRLPHAVVLEGESGLGKRTLAGELAAALVCRGEHRPCDSCPQCHKARAGVHPDILVYAPEGGARSFHKKTVDQIVGDVYMTPNEADYKIYILVNAHLMSVQAQNAILKVLEEPPAYVRFILTVENKSALLPTVLSRSVVFRLEGDRCGLYFAAAAGGGPGSGAPGVAAVERQHRKGHGEPGGRRGRQVQRLVRRTVPRAGGGE